MTSPFRDNLTETIFRALYPNFELVTIGSTYIVYPPPMPGSPLMYISDSLGAIARQISEHENPDVELADLLADDSCNVFPAEKADSRLPFAPDPGGLSGNG